MELQIPTVTTDDLRAFHAQHFPHAPPPEHILHGFEPEAEAAEEYYDEADDGLGYYPDGTKRTLTDEQIAMFRHSEIHAMLRKRRVRKENGEISDDNDVPASPAPAVPPTQEDLSRTDDVGKAQPEASTEPKKQQWATSSATTKAKAKRKRDRYAKRRKERRLERGLPRRRSGRDGADSGDSDDGSDEWDAWHQANGPDVQKDETLDLDY
ncbi:hypothetical protein J4E90_004262 [Alternaria incomplexa]|uniref:uncharacterized protein n=1 Tax=Alternaria incomplexa TaxID=1187928 RepID=UPI00221F8382|nr:uncharacterized protein J4E90_004262 [Alternaria incomplexa]KAI4915816.1 hypothetical protein J4E90_004262 [Alternaria incomplexa]